MNDVLLLDYNGVIVDDEPLHYAAFRDTLRDDGLVLDESAYYANYLGLDDRAAFREAYRRGDRPLDPAGVQRLVRRKAAAYAALAERSLVVVPGVRAFVRAAAREVRVAVVSGALRAEIEPGLRVAGLEPHVAMVVSAEDVPATKPDPAGYRLALARLADAAPTRAPRVIVMEDSLPGLAAARALGAACVMLTTSHPPSTLRGADLVWSDFEGHAPDELAGLWREVPA